MQNETCAACGNLAQTPKDGLAGKTAKGYWQSSEGSNAVRLAIQVERIDTGMTTTYQNTLDDYDPKAPVLTKAPYRYVTPTRMTEVWLCATCGGNTQTVWEHLLKAVAAGCPAESDVGKTVAETVDTAQANQKSQKNLLGMFDPRNWMKKGGDE
jgi:hypothetical protein